jgi:excinuclease ABC subunit A
VLDEPTIGLHPRDDQKLITTLKYLRDLDNTVLVVEHDEKMLKESDWIIELGPAAGKHGGRIVFTGTIEKLLKSDTITAEYLSGKKRIEIPQRRACRNAKKLTVRGAECHNLKKIDVEIPLGRFVVVTGVSGSGKSSLVDDVLYRSLCKKLYGTVGPMGKHSKIEGIEQIDKVIMVDQSPIGRTPRSNPATYTGVFTYIRDLFSKLPEAKVRGFSASRFSFNVKEGRCPECRGEGLKRIEMHFLPDVYVDCHVCRGKRYNSPTLEVLFKGKSIADVLEMSVEEALPLFENIPSIRDILQTLKAVGLGYISLGQYATTLSGGEAQRVKLSSQLRKRQTGKTLYILDEPTVGLHFDDVKKLLDVLMKLVEKENTVLVIEHNLEVIKCADYIIDLGPEGGDKGGYVVAKGAPEEIVKVAKSYTGKFLREKL